MARPAASSLALLTRKPEDKRCNEVANELSFADALRCAFNDAMLVLIVIPILELLNFCRINQLAQKS
jgi:hypothetical protein